MGSVARISTNWKEAEAVSAYTTGISLHSHTSMSEESLKFVHELGMTWPGVKALTRRYERICMEKYGIHLDLRRANWRPPLKPKMAYELEAGQIEKLGLNPLVSITDHDTIQAALLLRTVLPAHPVPMSVEWSAPYGATVLHMGIHNLRPSDCAEWMRRFIAYTAAPDDAQLPKLLAELHADPQTLIVLNHPLWDLHKVGPVHRRDMLRFVSEAGGFIHALELNGLRHAKENHEVTRMAKDTGHLLISGGDRHGLEPNAIINLTSATSFSEFVEEIRVEQRSHVHFMNQYQEPWEQRILRSTLNAVADFPQFMPGWQRWDDRVFHPDANGVMKPLSELWVNGQPARALRALIGLVRVMRRPSFSAPLSWMAHDVNELDWPVPSTAALPAPADVLHAS